MNCQQVHTRDYLTLRPRKDLALTFPPFQTPGYLALTQRRQILWAAAHLYLPKQNPQESCKSSLRLTLDSLSGDSLGMPLLMCLPSEATPSLADLQYPLFGWTAKKKMQRIWKKLRSWKYLHPTHRFWVLMVPKAVSWKHVCWAKAPGHDSPCSKTIQSGRTYCLYFS